ncbi:hypothetical protein SmJEL517_g04522 [Synchytrium microbalum]|uniref:K Homology domain-containing protein n=1 Tax=Synchytrium microbalum TaxID=1806994 RepID=A0A507C334_9FUNG|nr:uncharacterized protein SmJEL517_g04522 [Synchytrium microbalum]TPX32356.1 hypothetical protein SmJEL517_g04522 [Synchytrium microbalum]
MEVPHSPESPDRKRSFESGQEEDDTLERRKRQAMEAATDTESYSNWDLQAQPSTTSMEEDIRSSSGDNSLVETPTDSDDHHHMNVLSSSNTDNEHSHDGIPHDHDEVHDDGHSVQSTTSTGTTTHNTINHNHHNSSHHNNHSHSHSKHNPKNVETGMLRALVSTADAGIIIGKNGRNIHDIRQTSGARVSVSELVVTSPDRAITVSGRLDAVAKAFALMATKLAAANRKGYEVQDDDVSSQPVNMRLLIPAIRIGALIGTGGRQIKAIEEKSQARVGVSDPCIPPSSEREVAVDGVVDAIHIATYHIAAVLAEFPNGGYATGTNYNNNYAMPTPLRTPHRGNHHHHHGNDIEGCVNPHYAHISYPHTPYNMIPHEPQHHHMSRGYSPFSSMTPPPPPSPGGVMAPPRPIPPPLQFAPYAPNHQHPHTPMTPLTPLTPIHHPMSHPLNGMGSNSNHHLHNNNNYMSPSTPTSPFAFAYPTTPGFYYPVSAQHQIIVPSDLIGSVIGRGGAKIAELRLTTGCAIKVSDRPNESGQRMITVTGAPDAVQNALYTIYGRLDAEKQRLNTSPAVVV